MLEPLPPTLVDAALRGTLIALLLLLAGVLGRDRPRLPAARAGVALTLGLCVQVLSSTPMFEALVPRLWQAPLVATLLAAVLDTAVFWSIAFAGTGGPWVTWALGDLAVKLVLGVALLLPFRLMIGRHAAQRTA